MRTELTVEVPKEDLLVALRQNREKHVDKYRDAMQGYVTAVRKELTEKLARIDQGKLVDPYSQHRQPDSHTDDYDEVIGMLELAGNGHITLSQSDYRQYVNDDWGWKMNFEASAAAYTLAR